MKPMMRQNATNQRRKRWGVQKGVFLKLISLKKINLRTLNRSFIVMTQEVLK